MWSFWFRNLVFLITGIFTGSIIKEGNAVIFIIAAFFSAFIVKITFKKVSWKKLLTILMVPVGIFMYNHAMSPMMRPMYEFNNKYVTVTGRITDLPHREENVNVYIADVGSISYMGKSSKIRERVKITSEEEFKFGDSIIAEGFAETFSEKLNSGDFDYGRHYKSKGVYFKMNADSLSQSPKKFKTYSLTYFFTWIKSIISDRIYENFSGDEAALLKAVLTGYKDGFSEELSDKLYESQTMRLFYSPYMHISFLMMLVGILGAYVKKKSRDKILIFLLVLYGLFNFNINYIMKCAILASGIIIFKNKIGFSNYIDVFSMTAGILIISNPLIVYDAGFVMSSAAGLLIFYFEPWVRGRFKFIGKLRTRKFISTGVTLAIGMVPLQAYYFSVTTPYAFLLNFIYMPVLSVIWSILPANLIFGSLPVEINPIGVLLKGLIYFIINVPQYISALPGYRIALPRPDVPFIISFYLLLYLARSKYYRKNSNGFAIQAICAVMTGFAIASAFSAVDKINNLEINFVSVGHGDGAVISVPFRETIIIDGGGTVGNSDYDYGKKIFLPFLQREGYNNIDLAVVSHYHSDHCMGVIAAMEKLQVKEVLMPDCMEDNEYRLKIEELAYKKKIKLSYYGKGSRLSFPSGTQLEIISPDNRDLQSGDENDTSLGIRVVYGEFSALFTGDITEVVEKNHRGEWKECNVLKVPHHGSKNSSSEEFINEVSPEAAIISVERKSSYGLPSKQVTDRYRNMHIPVYRTDINGDIVIYADKNGTFRLNSYREF